MKIEGNYLSPYLCRVIRFQLNVGYLIVNMTKETRSRFVWAIHFKTLSQSCERPVVLIVSVHLTFSNHETTHLLLEVFFWHFILGVDLVKLVENIQVLLKSEKNDTHTARIPAYFLVIFGY